MCASIKDAPAAAASSTSDERVKSYGRGAAILSVGIGVTGLVTYAYFALASHALSSHDYGQITLLWSTIFIIVSVLYRPVEQMLSRTISDRSRNATELQRIRKASPRCAARIHALMPTARESS